MDLLQKTPLESKWTNGPKPGQRIDRTGFEKPTAGPDRTLATRTLQQTNLHAEAATLSAQAKNDDKFPSHIFLLGSSNNFDEVLLVDIDQLINDRHLTAETRIANSAKSLMHQLGDPNALSEEMKPFVECPIEQTKSPPLILVDPYLYIGPRSATARDYDGKDFLDLLREFSQKFNLAPRVMLIRPQISNDEPISVPELKRRYPHILDSHLGYSREGLNTVGDEDLDIILKRYQDSL